MKADTRKRDRIVFYPVNQDRNVLEALVADLSADHGIANKSAAIRMALHQLAKSRGVEVAR